MTALASIFLNFELPHRTTWFYFSLLLASALFFKFSRWLSIRNLDVVMLFLQVPGLFLVADPESNSRLGYVWLLCGSGYFLFRCLLDLPLEQRPALSPNLSTGGLACLAGALFAGLIVSVASPTPPTQKVRNPKSPILDDISQQSHNVGHEITKRQNPDSPDEASVWVNATQAVLCHLAIVIGLFVIGWRIFQDRHAGMAMAAFYLLLPYSTLYVTQWMLYWPMALLIWAIVAYRFPIVAGLLLGLAIATVYFPVFLLPLWASFYWKRGLVRFLIAVAVAVGICLGLVALQGWLSGEGQLFAAMPADISDWNPWRPLDPDDRGIWQGLHWAYRLPVFVVYVALVAVTSFWPRPKTLAHLIALSAAVLIGLQFWYANEGGAYVVWYLPLLLLMTFRPNLSGCQPPGIVPETDWLHHLHQRLAGWLRWGIGIPQPAEKVSSP